MSNKTKKDDKKNLYSSFEIKKCRVCLSTKLKNIISLGNLYLSDFVKRPVNVKKFPIDLVICLNCSLVQLKHTTPSKYLYTERYGYRSGINETMKKELADVVCKATKMIKLGKGDLVIDVGSNDGTLLSNYKKSIVTVGFEPVKKLAELTSKKATFAINDYFNYRSFKKVIPNKVFKNKAKIITSVAMFYDLEDPNRFLDDVTRMLREDGVFIIQQNYLVGMLEQNAFDNILHEHLEYYSLSSLEYLLDGHNLKVVEVEERAINGGSFRVYAVFKSNKTLKDSLRLKKMREKEKEMQLNKILTYKSFAKNVKLISKNIKDFIKKEVQKGKTVYVYGASTRGNTLLQYCDLNTYLIEAAVERNPEKWGKKIASVGIPIISENEARKRKPDYMLVLPWFFKKEFIKREKKYLEKGGHFIFPLPKLSIV